MGSGERTNDFNKWRKKQAAETSKTQLYDRFGHPLSDGDIVHLLAKQDVFWKVERVAPVLDPRAPAGTVELVLTSLFVAGLPGGQRVTDVLKVQDGEVIKEAQAQSQREQAEAKGESPREVAAFPEFGGKDDGGEPVQ